jgi:serine/threonine protein kinase
MKPDRPKRALLPPTPLAVGTQLGPYEVRHVLGTGAFGIVYRVTDHAADTDLAVREYLPSHLAVRQGPTAVMVRSPADAELFAQGLRFFVNESQLLSQARHPSLVEVYRGWEENGTAYMAMEMCAGRTLRDTMQARWKAPSEAALRATLGNLLSALDALHAAGVQHRDIAPHNIMLEPNGRHVLLDLDSPRRVTSARGDLGTLGPRDGFAPLELYGSTHKLDRGPWTDFYQLGATMHYLIAGKAPMAANKRTEEDRPGLALRRPDLRHSLEFLSVIDWMLALQPADRPQSLAQLRAALAGQPVPARHAPPRSARMTVTWRRHRRWLWIVPVVALVMAALAYVYRLWRTGLLPGFGP